jgi:hypothetical protein
MASLRPDQILDLVEATQKNFKSPQWVDLSMNLQKYYFARLMSGGGTRKLKKRPEKGGPELEWKLQVRNQNSGRNTGLYNVDVLSKVDLLDDASITWSFQDVNYIVDTREKKWNSGAEKIIDLTKVYEHTLYNDFFELMEPLMWSAPSSSTLDPMPPAGIPFWLQSSSTAAFGFNGGDPAGWTSTGAGGVLTSTYANWSNGTYTWAVLSAEDFVEKTCEAMDKCYFEAPDPFPNLVKERPSWGLYTVYAVIRQLRRLTQAQNENLGDDVAKYMNTVTVRGVPLEWVPALDNSDYDSYDSNNPLYGCNFETLGYFFKEGEAMARQPMQQVGNMHRFKKRFMDNAGNIVCYDRRRNFRAYSSSPI